MKTRKLRLWILAPIILLLMSMLVFSWNYGRAAEGDKTQLDETALKLVSEEYGVAVDQLKIEASAMATYQYSKQTAYDYKIYNLVTNAGYSISLDSRGQKVDQAALLAADAAAFGSLYGKIEPTLHEILAVAEPDLVVPVIIALVEPEGAVSARVTPNDNLTEAEYVAFRTNALAGVQASVDSVVVPFIDRLGSMGYEATSVGLVAYVSAQVKAGDLEAIAAMPEVRSMGLDLMSENQIDFAWYRTGYDQLYLRRVVGRGKLAAVEVQHGTDPGNPFLRYVVNDSTYRCTSASGHETGVLGIMNSSHTGKTGFAMGAQMWSGGSCLGYLSELSNRVSGSITWGADGVNNSWGYMYNYVTLTLSPVLEGIFDDIWRNTATALVFAAGNLGNDPAPKTGWISNPAGAYNLITVGAEDKTSPATMAVYSSYVDPTTSHGDMEKPEVTAPGSSMNSTTTASPWVGSIGSGTSFAAPIVTAMIADAGQRSVWILGWPEVMKASMMVSALRNIESGTVWSDKDGQGGVQFLYADDVFRVISTTGRGGMGYYCTAPYETTIVTVYVPLNKRIRFAIAWDTYSSYANYATLPSADLDLHVYNSGGSQVTGSHTFDNTYEIIDWTSTATGNYTFKIANHRCSGDPAYLGWAYWRQP